MAPFAPDIITDELNLVFGFLIGIAFGFVLEQAGFSSSRKLTGLFYGTDFTVLRVFFTAGITAMIGVLILGATGFLDTEIIFINPTYLWPAIIGGIIMGLGFVVGGYCPGTSVCAAAIGKIDALVFILGGIIGVLLFGEAYPLYDGFANGSFLGDLTVPGFLDLPAGLVTFLMILMAVGAFVMTTRIEQRVNASAISRSFPVRAHRRTAVAVVVLGIFLAFQPNRKDRLLSMAQSEEGLDRYPARSMTPDELAFRILDHDPSLQIIDVRDSSRFAALSLPGALNIPPAAMFGKQWRDILGDETRRKVFLSDDERSARVAAALALALGYKNTSVLQGGLTEFRRTLFLPPGPETAGTAEKLDARRFRAQAGPRILALIKEQAAGPKPAPRVVKRIVGGCGA
jgi:rhodanese-related sulfurtransferase